MSLSADLISVDPGNIKALALDLDGTILGPGAVMSERAIKAIRKCIRRGLKVIISTGRPIEGAEPFRSSLGAEGPMVYFNGAVVAHMPGSLILSSSLLNKSVAELCVDLSRETGIYCQAYFPGSAGHKQTVLITERAGPEREMYHKRIGILAEIGDLKRTLGECGEEGCIKAMFIAEPEKLELIRPALEERLGVSVYMTRTQTNFLELMNAGVSKGKGLKFVMERLSLKKEEVIAFGDDENDVPMFLEAGFSVAPSNAKDSVKAQANLVAGSNAEDGVIIFLEEFFGLNKNK